MHDSAPQDELRDLCTDGWTVRRGLTHTKHVGGVPRIVHLPPEDGHVSMDQTDNLEGCRVMIMIVSTRCAGGLT